MSSSSPHTGLDLDTRVLSEFIYALNIARRQILAYPEGHPIVTSSTEKLLEIIPRLLEFRTDITIGVARDTLLVGSQVLDNRNPVYRDLAGNLFDANVASLSISSDLDESEVYRFFSLLARRPEEIAECGGLDQMMRGSDLRGIRAASIDFNAFHATEVDEIHAPQTHLAEGESAAVWRMFIDGLVKGTLDPHGQKAVPEMIEVDPDLLAEILNEAPSESQGEVLGSYEEAITAFLKESDREQIKNQASQETFGRLGHVIDKLNPDVRRRFLNSTLKACSKRPDQASTLLEHLPQSAMLDALEQLDDTASLQIPQSLMDVLGKLAKHRGDESSQSRVSGRSDRSAVETAEQLSTLFQADSAQIFVPKDYQDALSVLAAAEIQSGMDPEQAKELVDTLDGHRIEQQFSEVLLDLLDREPDQKVAESIARNMEDLVEYFLETGDFPSLLSVHDHMSQHVKTTILGEDSPDGRALKVYEESYFVDQVLEGLDEWGKPTYPYIKGLIRRVGRPYVEPLLDLLAVEPSLSRRRLFLECLAGIGRPAIKGILLRLHDRRWFFVRNLVILLREIGDPEIIQPLGRLVGYAHPKVQYEVMRTFLHFNDPRADRYLSRELESDDPQTLLNAAKLASKCRSDEVIDKLAGLLNKRLPTEEDYAIKAAAINSLRESAMARALPELSRFLLNRNLLRSSKTTQLKVKAVESLEQYDTPEAAEIAAEVYRNSSGELARVAGGVCLQLSGRLP